MNKDEAGTTPALVLPRALIAPGSKETHKVIITEQLVAHRREQMCNALVTQQHYQQKHDDSNHSKKITDHTRAFNVYRPLC